MNSNTPQRRSPRLTARAAGAVGYGVAAVGVLLLAVPAATAQSPAPDPALRISVDNGQTSATVGDKLSYTVSVENLGAETVTDLRISQTMPPGLTFVSADRKGEARKGLVSWAVDLPVGSTEVFHTTMKVSATPDEVLRLATVACASESVAKPPIVCATHSDELPAGAQAAAADNQPASPDDSGSPAPTEVLLVGVVIALLAAAGTWVARSRRRRAMTASPST